MTQLLFLLDVASLTPAIPRVRWVKTPPHSAPISSLYWGGRQGWVNRPINPEHQLRELPFKTGEYVLIDWPLNSRKTPWRPEQALGLSFPVNLTPGLRFCSVHFPYDERQSRAHVFGLMYVVEWPSSFHCAQPDAMILQAALSLCGSDTSTGVSYPGWCRTSSLHGSDVRLVFLCKPDGCQGSV